MPSKIFNRTAKNIENHIARLNKRAAAQPIIPRKVSVKAVPAPARAPIAITFVPAVPAAPRYISTRLISKISQRSTNIPRPDFTRAVPAKSVLKSALKSALKTSSIKKPKKSVTFVGDAGKTSTIFHTFDVYQDQILPYRTCEESCNPRVPATKTMTRRYDGKWIMIRCDAKFKAPTRLGIYGPTGSIRTDSNAPTACFDCRLKKATQFLPSFSLKAMQPDGKHILFAELEAQMYAHVCDNCLTF